MAGLIYTGGDHTVTVGEDGSITIEGQTDGGNTYNVPFSVSIPPGDAREIAWEVITILDLDEDEEPEVNDDFPMYLEYNDWQYDHLPYDPEYGEHL